jgi:hypothetical protein
MSEAPMYVEGNPADPNKQAPVVWGASKGAQYPFDETLTGVPRS